MLVVTSEQAPITAPEPIVMLPLFWWVWLVVVWLVVKAGGKGVE